MPRPRRPSLPRGRTENCKTSPNQRGWKRRRMRRVAQQPPRTAPRTEPEKEGSVNRSAISSLPRSASWPLLSCTHWASPLPLSHPSILPGYHLLQGAKKRRGAETPAGLQNVQNLLLNPPILFHIFKTTKYDAKTKDQIENGIKELLMTVNPLRLRPRWQEEAQGEKPI